MWDIASAALAAVEGRALVRSALAAIAVNDPVYVIALGKAASGMALGAYDVLGTRLTAGFLATKYGHLEPALAATGLFQCCEAGHPLPDASRLLAGERLLAFIAASPRHATLLFLISGGTSAVVEVLAEGYTLDTIQRINNELLCDACGIAEINAQRQRFSRIKGGGLAGYLERRPALALLLSDVPGDDPAVIGSGLLWPMPEHVAATGRVRVAHRVMGGNATALHAAARHGHEHDLPVFLNDSPIIGQVDDIARQCVEALRAGPRGLYLWGGESTIKLPVQAGRGGRNQHLALTVARDMAGCDHTVFMALASDGSDGPGDDAGGLIDGATLARGKAQGLDIRRCLAEADSGAFLAASGDLLHTGPTGTNVMDLWLGLKT